MPNLFMKKKRISLSNINLKTALYKSNEQVGKDVGKDFENDSGKDLEKHLEKKFFVFTKKARIQEKVKLIGNGKYNENIQIFRNHFRSKLSNENHFCYCNFLTSDIITLLKIDIEDLKKKKKKNYFYMTNRKSSFKKILQNYIQEPSDSLFELIKNKYIPNSSLYNLFVILKLGLYFKSVENFKVHALEEFINKIEHAKEKDRQESFHNLKKKTKLILTFKQLKDNKLFIKHNQADNDLYIFDLIHYINNIINNDKASLDFILNKAKASKDNHDAVVTNSQNSRHTELFNLDEKNHYEHDENKKEHSRQPSLNTKKFKHTKFRFRKRDDCINRTDKIHADEIKYFFYNKKVNTLGVYKEIYEKSDQYKNLKFYEGLKKGSEKEEVPVKCSASELRESYFNCKNIRNNYKTEKINLNNDESVNISNKYLLKENVLNTFLQICVNNYDDKIYKYMKYLYFSNLYFYNPLFIFQYFQFIPISENKYYEKYLKIFLKFLNNIIINFHFYLIPFFINLNYSKIFFEFFKKQIQIDWPQTDLTIYRVLSTDLSIRSAFTSTRKGIQNGHNENAENEQNLAYALAVFYRMYRDDAVLQKWKKIYEDNFYFYKTEYERKKDIELVGGENIVDIFTNFLNYKTIFNKYETELRSIFLDTNLFQNFKKKDEQDIEKVDNPKPQADQNLQTTNEVKDKNNFQRKKINFYIDTFQNMKNGKPKQFQHCLLHHYDNKIDIILNDAKLKYNNISLKKKDFLTIFLYINKNHFGECSNYLARFIYFFLNKYNEKDIINIFVSYMKNSNGINQDIYQHDLLLINKMLNMFIYKKKNISLNNNIIISNILAKYQLYNNNFFLLDKSNFATEIKDTNIHSLVALIYSMGKLKIRRIHTHFYKLIIKEIIKKIDKINEYGLSCLLYGLNNLVDKKKEREITIPIVSKEKSLHFKKQFLNPKKNTSTDIENDASHNLNDLVSSNEIAKVENELIKVIINKLIVFKNMNINSFCISISCLSRLNIFPIELYDELKDITYKYMHTVNVTSLQHLLHALSKYYLKTRRQTNDCDEIIYDIYNYLFIYKYKEISFKCACKFLHILSLLNLRNDDYILLLLLIIANEQRVLENSYENQMGQHISTRWIGSNINKERSTKNLINQNNNDNKKGYLPTDESTKKYPNSIFKKLEKIKEDRYFKSSYNSYMFFDIKDYKFEMNNIINIFKNVDNSYLINIIEGLHNLSYYSYFSIHLFIIIKNILIKQIHDMKVSNIISLFFSYLDLHFFDYSLYNIESNFYITDENNAKNGCNSKEIPDCSTTFDELDKPEDSLNIKMESENINDPIEDPQNDDKFLRAKLNNVYKSLTNNFKILSEEEKKKHVEELKMIMARLKQNKNYFVESIYQNDDIISPEYIISMLHDYNNSSNEFYNKTNFMSPPKLSNTQEYIPNSVTNEERKKELAKNVKQNETDWEKNQNNFFKKNNTNFDENPILGSTKKTYNFGEVKNIVDNFCSERSQKINLKNKSLSEKLEKKQYYENLLFLKYREYYKEDLVNLCLETLLKNTNYILNNYKQYKNCSIFFLSLFYNIFFPYTNNDIFIFFKSIQKNYNIYNEPKNYKNIHNFESILKNIELSDFTEDTIKNIVGSKNLSHAFINTAKNNSHLIIPYLNILQHDNNFLDKAILNKKTEIENAEIDQIDNEQGIGTEKEANQTNTNNDIINEYEYFINTYNSDYTMKKINIEKIVPLNLLYKFFQLFNFNINNIQLIHLLNETNKENDFTEKSEENDNSEDLKLKKKYDILPYQFRNIHCPLIQIKNKTLIVHKNSKKVFSKNINIIDHYFKPSQGLIIQHLDNHMNTLINIYVDIYVVAYKVDILIERKNTHHSTG
ncbi:conserved Plasmodium protein, unknown function [Plasmodium chabaudi chabaudi]|uniref:Uncharacterized protein n=1 Tax=Plasmodium chabaudi chabaudi TaxID=31271 RepID=A0A1C6YTP4_PLACU|nr:conserved Plasmodium protein, unknown function [Plasmodium chabaudi chabaudi]